MNMQRFIHLAAVCTAFLVGSLAAIAHDTSAPLSEAQKAFLTKYESVRAALAADDLAAAKSAAVALAQQLAEAAKKQSKAQDAADAAGKIASAESLTAARDAFKTVSKHAVHLASGKEGYYVAHCPMVKGGGGDWVQTTAEINNPYFGESMLTCGSITSGDKKAGGDAHSSHH